MPIRLVQLLKIQLHGQILTVRVLFANNVYGLNACLI